MSHPALFTRASHEAIHQAAESEVQDVMYALRQALHERPDDAPELARVLTAVWDERILRHAASEEDSLYPAASRVESLAPLVSELTRDHELLRRWTGEVRENLEAEGRVTGFSLSRLEAMLLVLGEHQKDEERLVSKLPADLQVREPSGPSSEPEGGHHG